MANNKYSESVEDKAFKALDEALQIDFSDEGSQQARNGQTPDTPENRTAPTAGQRSRHAQATQEDATRRAAAARAAVANRASETPKTTNFAPANDANRP